MVILPDTSLNTVARNFNVNDPQPGGHERGRFLRSLLQKKRRRKGVEPKCGVNLATRSTHGYKWIHFLFANNFVIECYIRWQGCCTSKVFSSRFHCWKNARRKEDTSALYWPRNNRKSRVGYEKKLPCYTGYKLLTLFFHPFSLSLCHSSFRLRARVSSSSLENESVLSIYYRGNACKFVFTYVTSMSIIVCIRKLHGERTNVFHQPPHPRRCRAMPDCKLIDLFRLKEISAQISQDSRVGANFVEHTVSYYYQIYRWLYRRWYAVYVFRVSIFSKMSEKCYVSLSIFARESSHAPSFLRPKSEIGRKS